MEDTVKACPAVMAIEHCGLLILEHGGHGQGLSGSDGHRHCGLLILEHGGHGQGLPGSDAIEHCGLLILEHGGHGQGLPGSDGHRALRLVNTRTWRTRSRPVRQ